MRRILLGFFFSLIWSFSVEAQAPFYQGKTISIIVGNKAGDATTCMRVYWASTCPRIFPVILTSLCRICRGPPL